MCVCACVLLLLGRDKKGVSLLSCSFLSSPKSAACSGDPRRQPRLSKRAHAAGRCRRRSTTCGRRAAGLPMRACRTAEEGKGAELVVGCQVLAAAVFVAAAHGGAKRRHKKKRRKRRAHLAQLVDVLRATPGQRQQRLHVRRHLHPDGVCYRLIMLLVCSGGGAASIPDRLPSTR